MANDLSGRPWVVDTANAATIHSGNAYVKGITFSGYAAAADEAIITFKSAAGNTDILVTLQGHADLSPVFFDLGLPIWVRDIAVSVLTSGKVSIFV